MKKVKNKLSLNKITVTNLVSVFGGVEADVTETTVLGGTVGTDGLTVNTGCNPFGSCACSQIGGGCITLDFPCVSYYTCPPPKRPTR